jgi:uncharacterized OB-fold protein
MAPYRVLPVPDQMSRPYWDGAKQHKIMIQRCQTCGFYNHPPQFICMGCKDRSAELKWEEIGGRGTIYSWFIHHDTQVGGFEDKVPFLVAAIEMDASPGLLLRGNLINCPFDEVEIGMPVEVVWESASDEIEIAQWQPAH